VARSRNWSIWKSRRLTLLLLAADVLGLSLCWFGAWGIRYGLGRAGWMGPINTVDPYRGIFPILLGVWVADAALLGLYIHRRRLTSLNTWRRIFKAGYHALIYAMVVGFLFKRLDLGRSVILLSGILVFLYHYFSRTLLRILKRRAIRQGKGPTRALIVGLGPLAMKVRDSIRRNLEIGYELAGFLAHPSEPAGGLNGEAHLLGTTDSAREIIERERIEEVFLAIGHLSQDEQLNVLNAVEIPGVQVHLVSNLFGVLTQDVRLDEIVEFPVVALGDGRMPWHQEALKQAFDWTVALAGAVVWLFFFHWWIALCIRRDSPGPVFFRHKRAGRGGRLFWCYKYRTMRTDAKPYEKAPVDGGDPRVTQFGRFLRRTSLDELPQILNVLRGEMSMVGPRPEMPFLVEQYEPWQRRRLDVKPGITGLWQVIGRKNLPLHLNIQYDLYYVRNRSLMLDMEILLKTIPAVIWGRGAF